MPGRVNIFTRECPRGLWVVIVPVIVLAGSSLSVQLRFKGKEVSRAERSPWPGVFLRPLRTGFLRGMCGIV